MVVSAKAVYKPCEVQLGISTPKEFLSILAAAFRGFEVRITTYYSNHVLEIGSSKDAIVINVVFSKKEATVPRSQYYSLRRTTEKVLNRVIKRLKKKKHVSGIAVFFVGNFSRSVCKREKTEIQKVPCAIHTIKHPPNGRADVWIGYIFASLKKWISSRYKRLEMYCRNKDESNNALLKELYDMYDCLVNAERRCEYYPALGKRATVITAAALERSLGIPVTPRNVMPISKILAVCAKGTLAETVKELDEVTRILDMFCIKEGKVYKPPRSLAFSYAQLLSRDTDKLREIRLVTAKAVRKFGRNIHTALPLYVLHWLTRRGIIPENWEKFRGLVRMLAELMNTTVNMSIIDSLSEELPKPAILLTGDTAWDLWRLCYRRRR